MSPSPEQPSKSRPRRWRLQYGLRSLLLLMVACAVVAAYVARFQREHDAEQPAIAALQEIGGKFETAPRGPAWLRWLAGEKYAMRVVSVDLHAEVHAHKGGFSLWSPRRWVWDDWLARLHGLEHLETLDLHHQPITAAGLEHLSQFKRLTTLDLSLTRVNSDALAHLTNLPQLLSLDLSSTCVDDAALAHLAGVLVLRSLNLEGTKISDAGLAHLAGLANLVELRLEGTAIGDAGLAHLAGLSGLEKLSLADISISDDGLKHLAGLTHLVQLRMGEWSSDLYADEAPEGKPIDPAAPRLTENGLRHLRGLAQLEELSLTGVLVSDVGIEELEHLPKLAELDLNGSRLTKAAIARLGTWKHLRVLHVGDGFQRYDKEELDQLEKALPTLQVNPQRASDPVPP